MPRFVRADEHGSAHAGGQPLAVLRDPGHRFTLDLTVDGAATVSSPTHSLDAAQSEGRVRVRLRDGEVVPDRDCVLTWLPQRHATRPTLQLLTHSDASLAASHFLALVVPPESATAHETVPREVILLIDHSGSMSGPKWDAADWAVQNLLAGLTAGDTFNLGLFHSTTRWFARQPVRGDERTVRQARDFLLHHKDSGGTELGVALEQALTQKRDAAGRARHVLIVTDAQVSDAGRILALVEREANRTDRRRVDVLCVDAAPNSGLANELSERGGGIARFLTSDAAENDIASALDEVLADWAAPIMRNLTLQIGSPDVQAAGRRVTPDGSGQCTLDLGDLPAGRAVWVAGRIDGTSSRPGASPSFRLLADGSEIATESAGTDTATASHPAVAALFGARRVLDIELAQSSGVELAERLRQLGYDPRQVLEQPGAGQRTALYPENARRGTTDALQALLVRESLRYGIACSATAFVATRSEAGERTAGTVAVANALAHGWSEDFTMARLAMASPMAFADAAFSARSAAPPAGPMPAPMMPPPPPGAMYDSVESWSAAPEPYAPQPGSPGAGAPGAGAPGSFDFGALASAPLDLARGLARRFRDATRPQDTNEYADEESTPASASGPANLFSGTPSFADGEAVLFDSRAATANLSAGGTLKRLMVQLGAGATGGQIDRGLEILIFVDDLTAPRARVRLADLIRQGGERPLNVRRRPGQVVRIVLRDPNGA